MYNYIYAHTTVSFIVSQIYVYLCDDDDDDDSDFYLYDRIYNDTQIRKIEIIYIYMYIYI